MTVEQYRISKYGPLETPEDVAAEIDTVTQTAAIPDVPDVPVSSAVPIPEPSPMAAYAEPEQPTKGDRPFWKFW